MQISDQFPNVSAVCNLVACECDALAQGACAEPRDEDACRDEIADAVAHCNIIVGYTPDRPDPDNMDLDGLDAICPEFSEEHCTMSYSGSFCTGERLSGEENQAFCTRVCNDVVQFTDYSFSGGDERYECGTISRQSVATFRGAKEECQADCEALKCEADNLDECTVISIPTHAELDPDDLSHCNLGYEGDPFCRAPDQDPPVLEAGGILAETITRRSLGDVVESQSEATFELGDETFTTDLNGFVDILGRAATRMGENTEYNWQPSMVRAT